MSLVVTKLASEWILLFTVLWIHHSGGFLEQGWPDGFSAQRGSNPDSCHFFHVSQGKDWANNSWLVKLESWHPQGITIMNICQSIYHHTWYIKCFVYVVLMTSIFGTVNPTPTCVMIECLLKNETILCQLLNFTYFIRLQRVKGEMFTFMAKLAFLQLIQSLISHNSFYPCNIQAYLESAIPGLLCSEAYLVWVVWQQKVSAQCSPINMYIFHTMLYFDMVW